MRSPTGRGAGVPPSEMRALLVRAVAHHCPPELRAEKEDLAHVAWLRIVERQSGEDFSTLEPSYLWRVAFTVVIDEIRRRSARRAHLERLRAAPVETASPADVGQEIRDCLDHLLEARRLAVVLHLQGFRNFEVARSLQWSEKRAENLVYRGLEELRRCLTGKGVTPR